MDLSHHFKILAEMTHLKTAWLVKISLNKQISSKCASDDFKKFYSLLERAWFTNYAIKPLLVTYIAFNDFDMEINTHLLLAKVWKYSVDG